MNYSIKLVEIKINIKVLKRKEKIFQHFIFGKGKDIHYLKDPRYLIYDKFERKIRENILNLEFLRRRNEKDRVILEYSINKNYFRILNKIFIVAEFIPPNPGCEYCKYKFDVRKNGFFTCGTKLKVIIEDMEKCKFFRQKDLYKT